MIKMSTSDLAKATIFSLMITNLAGCGGSSDSTNPNDSSSASLTNDIAETSSLAAQENNTAETSRDTQTTTRNTIVDAAIADGRFTTLVTALQATQLDSVLSDTTQTFTVFAPTDDAFNALAEGTLEALLGEAELTTLSDILLYHVISGLPEAVPADVALMLASQGEPANMVTMANSDNITLNLQGPEQNLFINDSKVIITDLVTDNGIIHVIDAVLTPPVEIMVDHSSADDADEEMNNNNAATDDNEVTMNDENQDSGEQSAPIPNSDTDQDSATNSDVVCDSEQNNVRSVDDAIRMEADLSILSSLLSDTGLNETLRNVFTEQTFTVFAPTDTAFANLLTALGSDAIAAFETEGTAGLIALLGADTVTDILLYHVLGLTADASTAVTLVSSSDSADRIVPTLNGDAIQLSLNEEDALFVNRAQVVCTDLGAKNGVVHKVDAVIQFPSNTDIVHVAALKPQISTFNSLIDLTDLGHLLRASNEVTVLAPSDAAFAELDPATVEFLLSDEGRETLVAILKQHIIIQQPAAGDVAIPFATALQADGAQLKTAAGDDVLLTVHVSGSDVVIEGATVIDPDNIASNGIIHVIDAVIVEVH